MRVVAVAVAAVTFMAGFGPAAGAVAFAADPAVTVDVSPASPKVGATVTVSGDVTGGDGQPVGNAMLTATRTDSAGDHPLTVDMADGTGHYSFTDVPAVRGDVTWTVTWRSPGGDVSGRRPDGAPRHGHHRPDGQHLRAAVRPVARAGEDRHRRRLR
jgi:hypothetical protein